MMIIFQILSTIKNEVNNNHLTFECICKWMYRNENSYMLKNNFKNNLS
jgi:hypothetical protein